MKVVHALLLSLLSAGVCLSQTLPHSPEKQSLTVLQKQWRVELFYPLMNESPLDLLDRVSEEELERLKQADAVSRQVQRSRQSQAQILPQPTGRSRPVSTPELKPPPESQPPVKLGETKAVYIYKVKIKNEGEKAIRALMWEYVFTEPATGREVGRRRFVSKTKISPGKTRELVMRSASPPTGTISAANSGKESRDMYSEQVIIQIIQYEDGSIWKAARTRVD